jgi:hypothetical protein
MGAGAFLEPATVVFLLVAGCWVNRKVENVVAFDSPQWSNKDEEALATVLDPSDVRLPPSRRSSSAERPLRSREIRVWWFRTAVSSPDTTVFADRWFSKFIQKFPFLVEVWYWALIYWVSTSSQSICFISLTNISSPLRYTKLLEEFLRSHYPRTQSMSHVTMLSKLSNSRSNCISSGKYLFNSSSYSILS